MIATEHKSYEKDFCAWAFRSAELLRNKQFGEIDIENIAEEIESMGKSARRELTNRLAVLFAHLLKWKFQPERRGNSWKNSIEEQRDEIIELIEDSPSLKYELNDKLERAYKRGVLIASTETEMPKEMFPENCPFTLEDCLNIDFLPE